MKRHLLLSAAAVLATGLWAGGALTAEKTDKKDAAPAAGAPPPSFPMPQRQLGPPPGAGAGLEGTETEAPATREQPTIIVVPQSQARPAEAPKLPDRLKSLLGEVEILDIPLKQIPNYRDAMRTIVEDLSIYAHGRSPKFIVVTRPGFDLLAWSRREFDLTEIKRDPMAKLSMDTVVPVGMPMRRYLQRIDGVLLNGQFCAPLRVPRSDLEMMMKEGMKFLSAEHCHDDADSASALQAAMKLSVVAHVDTDLEDSFSKVPRKRPVPENSGNVETLSAARNMLVMTENRSYGSKEEWFAALGANNYDVLVTDAFFKGNQPLTKNDVHGLKFKQMGARRLVLARMNVGFAEDERFYWKREWHPGEPSWIQAFVGDKPGEYVVEFWNPAWKAIIGKYFAGIMDLGFDGVVIDGAEAYRRWEFMTPIDPTRGS